MIRVAIVEDEKEQAERIRRFLDRFAAEKERTIQTHLYSDGDEFVRDLNRGFDIALLDIQMKRMNGMQAAEEIRRCDEEMILIFITNLVQYAVQGYSVNAMNFLLKPVSYFTFCDKFMQAVKRLEKRQGALLEIKTDKGFTRLRPEEIHYVEIVNRRLVIRTADKDFYCTEPMQNLEEKLGPHMFFRCHVAYLVNLEHVRQVMKNSAMVEQREVLVSKYRKKEFLNALTNYMGGEI
ncbi:MAG: response regulator transcription factor [Lachnospiraceae bacterium]|nr:response regulator transcription factor [Lachnospiraceae bacterium]